MFTRRPQIQAVPSLPKTHHFSNVAMITGRGAMRAGVGLSVFLFLLLFFLDTSVCVLVCVRVFLNNTVCMRFSGYVNDLFESGWYLTPRSGDHC